MDDQEDSDQQIASKKEFSIVNTHLLKQFRFIILSLQNSGDIYPLPYFAN
jgi:hypothetical protein